MKKLSLIVAMLMSAGILANAYADDLSNLDSLDPSSTTNTTT